MSLAKQTLEALSQDPELHRRARERADAIKLYDMDLAASRKEGRKEGRTELLLELLAMRFGPPSAGTRARVEAATLEQLHTWSTRVLANETLDEVLAS